MAAAPQQPSRQSPQPAPAPPAGLGPAEQPQTPERQKPAPQLSPNKAPEGSQGHAEPIRTPGSSRNRLPERPSTFDIPLDEEQFRSNKRRRIGECSIQFFLCFLALINLPRYSKYSSRGCTRSSVGECAGRAFSPSDSRCDYKR